MVRGSLGGQRSGAGCSGCNGQDLGTKGNGQDRGSCCVGPKEPNDTYRTSVVITLGRGPLPPPHTWTSQESEAPSGSREQPVT